MSTCYILPIGGTGIRVMRSLLHILAAGGFNDSRIKFDNYKILCVDSDGNNGDSKEFRDIYVKYSALRKFATNMPPINCWSESGDLFWSPLPGNDNDMRTHIGDFNANQDAKDILEFLYTKEELGKKLNEGFYGHTSIGSYFTSYNILDENHKFSEVWDRYFENIGEDDKVFIIGSVFGGTGASGIPTISRILRDNIPEEVPIGAVLVMPYFRPVGKNDENVDLDINWRAFNSKVKMALSFYESQNFDEVFRTMYFIGENEDNFMNVPYCDGGNNQKNKANPIETYAAAVLFDFLASPQDDNFRTKFYVIDKEYDSDPHILQEPLDNVVKGANIFKKMTSFFLFSSIYTKFMNVVIEKRNKNMGWLRNYENVYGKNFLRQGDFNRILADYCESYMAWFRDQHIITNEFGETELEGNKKVKWLEFESCRSLFFVNPITCKFTGYKLKELDSMASVVMNKGRDLRHTGEDIINTLSTASIRPASDGRTTYTVFMQDVIELCGREVNK